MRFATVGDNCIDLYTSLGQAFPGGNPVNVGVYAVRMGEQASYTGVVGNDANGEIIRAALNKKGVDTTHLRTVEGSTAVTEVNIVDGERVFGKYSKGVLAGFKLREEDIHFLCTHDIIVTGLWGMVENDLGRIKEKGGVIAFDFATKTEGEILEQAVPFVDYAFFSYDKGNDDFIRNFLKRIQQRGVKIAVATLGKEGSIAYNGSQFVTYGVVPCEVRDTMGAGDSYIAGFLTGVLRQKELKLCMMMGAQSSSVTLQYVGAWS